MIPSVDLPCVALSCSIANCVVVKGARFDGYPVVMVPKDKRNSSLILRTLRKKLPW